MYTTERYNDEWKPAHFESNGMIQLNGEEGKYHTVCEDTVLYDKEGKKVA